MSSSKPSSQISLDLRDITNLDSLLRATTPIRIRIMVTPAIAKHWLDETNKKNRKPTDGHWLEIAIDMEQGRWKYNGETIKFGSDGVMLDGQHRLLACVEAGVPFDTDVIFGLDPGVLDTIDTDHLPRTAAHVAQMEGVENATGSAALAYLLLVHEKYGIHRIQNVDCKPTKTEVIARVKADRRIAGIAGRSMAWSRRMVQPRVVGFCFYLFSSQNAELAERFFEEFAEGANLAKCSPVFLLRRRMLDNVSAKAKLPLKEIIALFFKAWIAYSRGRALKALVWHSGGNHPEPFPQI
jgi:hypothetical protein